MSTTTQILFNSPALHSLKRDQLIKLCKIHSIKASGKNSELIEKLKKHADTLPRDSPLSIAARSEEPSTEDVQEEEGGVTMDGGKATDKDQSTNARWNFQMPRPSEQWEVIMESIEETEENSSQGTLTSLRTLSSTNGGSGEFGTGMSKSSSVSSSIKALASSFGLKRGNTSNSTIASSSSFPASSSFKPSPYKSSVPLKADKLTEHSTPYSSLPASNAPPLTDHFTFDPQMQAANDLRPTEPPTPLPGQSLRPGIPAPANARLSLGLNPPLTPTRKDQPTTTIRLISNPVSDDDVYGRTPQLKPFKTSFDLVLGSPQPATGGFRGVSLWPNDGAEYKRIYPALPLGLSSNPSTDTQAFHNKDSDEMETNEDIAIPGSLSFSPASHRHTPLKTPAPSASETLTVSEPFVFGSPLPQHNVTNTQFKSAAASVLEEMNRRLREEGVASVGMDLISKLQPGAHANGVGALSEREVRALPKIHSGVTEKFEKMHEQEFRKMEGIDGLMRRRGMSPKRDEAEANERGRDGESAVAIGKKRKSSVLGHGAGRDRYGRRVSGASRVSATRVISNGRRPRVIPGSFDEDSEDEGRDEGKEDSVDERDGKRIRIDASAMQELKAVDGKVPAMGQKTGNEQQADLDERKRKEKEAIRRKLELNKARRRSSAGARGRVSVGRGGVVLVPQPKPPRFGFLSSAKSLVQTVWNRGKNTSAPSSSSIPKPTTTHAPPLAPVPAPKKVPSFGSGPTRPSTVTHPNGMNRPRVPSLRVDKDKAKGTVGSTSTTSTARARSPLPSFAPVSSSRNSFVKPNRNSSVVGMGTSAKSADTIPSGVSSIGTTSRSSSSSSNILGGVSSMGSKKVLTGTSAAGSSSSRLSSKISSSRSSSSSRLLAPTASSLAKTIRPSISGSGSTLKSVNEVSASGSGSHTNQEAEALHMITNSPGVMKGPWSPRPGGIFSKPLQMPPGNPSPVKKRAVESFTSSSMGGAADGSDVGETSTSTTAGPPARQRSVIGRKPRISRSKVIVKLASQRAAAGSSGSITGKLGGTSSSGRMRSSLGMKAQRASFGGNLKGAGIMGAGNSVLLSAKKRARQSEYMRRRSRAAPISFGEGLGQGKTMGGSGDEMDVDGA